MEVLLAGNTGYVKNFLFFQLSDHAWKDDRRTGTTETDTSVMQKE